MFSLLAGGFGDGPADLVTPVAEAVRARFGEFFGQARTVSHM
jgi:hypothetical protein